MAELTEAKIIGVEKLLKRFNAKVKKIRGYTTQGVLNAALEIRADAVKFAPVDTANLRSSAYTVAGGPKGNAYRSGTIGDRGGEFKPSGIRTKKVLPETMSKLKSNHQTVLTGMLSQMRKSKEPIAATGFTAFYAVFVHEIKKNYTEGGHKFLERSVKQNQKRLLNEIKKEAAKAI